MTTSTIVILAAGAAFLLGVLVTALAAALAFWIVKGFQRQTHRNEQVLFSKLEDLLDRNMHLTDGGAFGARVGAPGRRRLVDDDEQLRGISLEEWVGGRDGILRDPENFGGDLASISDVFAMVDAGHDQPTVHDLT